MGIKPDYGFRLMREGLSPKVDLYFYDFHLFSLSVLGDGKYSTMVETEYEGEVHALSLDFDHAQLEQILDGGNDAIANFIRAELIRDSESQRTIDFEGYLVFGVRARLGQLQTAAQEQFVPLVTQEIFSCSPE